MLILMSMKLHVVAASDIINKGLDLSFPHSELGADGLLVYPSVKESGIPAIVVSELTNVLVQDIKPEAVETPELVTEPVVVNAPTVEKTGRKQKKS
jgi:hypothetical protein